MPNLTDNWTLDRAPGQGKAIDSTGAGGTPDVHIPGPIVVGTTSPPAVYPPLPEPGVPIPPVGSPDRWKWYLTFLAAVGFDGNTFITLPTAADGNSFSLSVWLDGGVNTVPGFACDPYGTINSSVVFATAPNGGGTTEETGMLSGLIASGSSGQPNGTPIGPNYENAIGPFGNKPYADGGTSIAVGDSAAFAYPSDETTNAGWVHVMYSWERVNSTTYRQICYINDTLQQDATYYIVAGNSNKTFSFSVGNYIGTQVDGSNNPITSLCIKIAMCEYWLMCNKFIDWNDPKTRAKFHTQDSDLGALGSTWVPVDLGPRGARPGFGIPTAYLSGGSSLFPYNRATGAKLTVTATGVGAGLFDVDDGPSSGAKLL